MGEKQREEWVVQGVPRGKKMGERQDFDWLRKALGDCVSTVKPNKVNTRACSIRAFSIFLIFTPKNIFLNLN